MNDDDLRGELERRSANAAVPDLLPGISARLFVCQERPPRAVHRAPLAGLAAAAIIVVALIIAFPRGSLVGPAASATPAVGTDVQCLLDGVSTQITISDETGLIRSCAAIRIDGLSSPATVEQGPTRTLVLTLAGSPCDIEAPLRFTRESSRYALRSSRPPGDPCPASQMEATIRLDLSTPIDRASVSVLLGAAAATALPTTNFDCGTQITVVDHSGQMTSCVDGGEVQRLSSAPSVSNPEGDLHRVHILWDLSESITRTTIDVYRTSYGAYYVSVVNGASPYSVFKPVAHAVDLVLAEPVPATSVTLYTHNGSDAATPPSSASNSPSPTLVTPRTIACGGEMTLDDTTGLVDSCSDAGSVDYRFSSAYVSVDPERPSLLQLQWGQSDCSTSYDIRVSQGSTVSADYVIDVSTHSQEGCTPQNPDAHAADIQFGSAVDAKKVQLIINGQRLADPIPCTPDPGLLDDGDGVNIYDSTDLITGCSQRQPTTDSTGRVSNLTASSLVIRWTDFPCGVAIHLLFDATGDGFAAVTKAGQCMVNQLMPYEIVIDFAQPVSAAKVDASSISAYESGATPSPSSLR